MVPGLTRLRVDAPLEEYCALGTADDCVRTIRNYIEAGASKFIMRPACRAEEIDEQIGILAEAIVQAVEGARV